MQQSPNDKDDSVKKAQRGFYADGKAGCAFAALAAKNPIRYGWKQAVLPVSADQIVLATEQAIADSDASMISLIFPSIRDFSDLNLLLSVLAATSLFYFDEEKFHAGFRCIGVRARVGNLESWVSGFGPFETFPITRQAPFVEIAFRVKSRPNYQFVMKKSPEGVIHVADLDFFGDIAAAAFKTIWHSTIKRTAQMLGHAPDLRSAAKTTFSIPI